ncbi:MAG TPA: hypothetical protein VNM37_22580, partial [Candidatus Dormibacteraeota bacterium]|nr:hypothetical protein [Candidatus Dormibacteraeota bacterium]
MKPCLVLVILSVSLLGSLAAPDGFPAASNVGNAEYPRITSDLRVTLRLKAPNAKQVKLEGGTGL